MPQPQGSNLIPSISTSQSGWWAPSLPDTLIWGLQEGNLLQLHFLPWFFSRARFSVHPRFNLAPWCLMATKPCIQGILPGGSTELGSRQSWKDSVPSPWSPVSSFWDTASTVWPSYKLRFCSAWPLRISPPLQRMAEEKHSWEYRDHSIVSNVIIFPHYWVSQIILLAKRNKVSLCFVDWFTLT